MQIQCDPHQYCFGFWTTRTSSQSMWHLQSTAPMVYFAVTDLLMKAYRLRARLEFSSNMFLAFPAIPMLLIVQVLPEHVPSPLHSFSWEEIQDIEVPDMIAQLHEASWLLSDAYPRLSPEARGNATREELEWAVSVSIFLRLS